MMYFYECLKEKQVHIPLYSGYNENKRKRTIKVDEFLNKIKKKLEERIGNFAELSDSEIFIAGVWLREKIRYMSDFRTKKIDDQIITLRKLLGDFFAFKVKSIHKCPPNVFPKLDLNQLVVDILPTETRQETLNDALSIEYKQKRKK